MANEPVSPMKILAGAAFHHKKPKHAPASATDERARSNARAHVIEPGVAELPVPDDGENGEAERGRTRRQAVEPVGEVHGV